MNLVGIIGKKPSKYSKSPALWNRVFKTLGVSAEYRPFDVSERNLGHLIRKFRKNNSLKGFNVTVPHKIHVMRYLDAVDADAKQIGAVNTVVRTSNGKLIGYNTDGQGLLHALALKLKGKNVLLIGAGGAGRAAAFALAKAVGKSGQLIILNRDVKKAKELSGRVRKFCQSDYGSLMAATLVPDGIDLVVNATSIGQRGTPLKSYSPLGPLSSAGVKANASISLATAKKFPRHTKFFDLVYAPPETPFLRHARQSGRKTQNGLGMIVAQAAEGFLKMWPDADPRRVRAAFARQI